MSPNVNPPANAAPLLRSSLRLVRFESISPSFERNDTTTKSRARGREHMPACQIWPVLMSRGLRILKRQLVRRLPAAWRVGADHPQAQPSSVRNHGYAIRAVVPECVAVRSFTNFGIEGHQAGAAQCRRPMMIIQRWPGASVHGDLAWSEMRAVQDSAARIG